MENLRVCINTYPTAYITPGGGEVQLKKTYEALKKMGCEVNLYDQWNPQWENVDIVHFFSVYGGSLPFCKAVKAQGKKLVISPVIWLDDMSKYPIGEIRELLSLADLILPNSMSEAEMLHAKLGIPMAKFRVICNAIDPQSFSSIDKDMFRQKYGLNKYLLNVGNIELRKNQLNLIRAVRDFELPLVIIGHIRDEEYAAKCRKEGGKGKVIFIDPLPHNSSLLLSAYAGAECFVLPSTLETPGLAALEAVAAGCPRLVITSVGCTREYFGEDVCYVEEISNPQSIRETIEESLRQPPIPAFVLKKIKDKFNWQSAAQNTLKAYEKVMDMEPVVIPDIYAKGVELEGVYELEFDGKRHFRWGSNKFVIKRGTETVRGWRMECELPNDTAIKIGNSLWQEYHGGPCVLQGDFLEGREKTSIHVRDCIYATGEHRKLAVRVFSVVGII